jgi:chorismate lyase / 3-hydroxybenzoate synthase
MNTPTRPLADSSTPAPLQAGFAREAANPDAQLLAQIRFGEHTAGGPDPRLLTLALPPLLGEDLVEIWRCGQTVQAGWQDGFGYARAEDVLFFQLLLDEAAYPCLAAASHDAYARLLAFVRMAGYPHLLRVWNYFPHINAGAGADERYQQFCLGRAQALETTPGFEARLPAATVIGSLAPGFVIYGLAVREPGLQIENPRQVSAFRYPRQYAPRSPAFSRARLKRWGESLHLYVSGTASVVGHETRHPHAALAQLGEAIRNLEALLAQASRAEPQLPPGHLPDLSLLKLYVRPGVELPPLQAMLQGRLGSQTPCLLLSGEICRRDLLVELEGLYATAVAMG